MFTSEKNQKEYTARSADYTLPTEHQAAARKENWTLFQYASMSSLLFSFRQRFPINEHTMHTIDELRVAIEHERDKVIVAQHNRIQARKRNKS